MINGDCWNIQFLVSVHVLVMFCGTTAMNAHHNTPWLMMLNPLVEVEVAHPLWRVLGEGHFLVVEYHPAHLTL